MIGCGIQELNDLEFSLINPLEFNASKLLMFKFNENKILMLCIQILYKLMKSYSVRCLLFSELKI